MKKEICHLNHRISYKENKNVNSVISVCESLAQLEKCKYCNSKFQHLGFLSPLMQLMIYQ